MDPFFGLFGEYLWNICCNTRFFRLLELAARSNWLLARLLGFKPLWASLATNTKAMSIRQLLVDVHTHCYLPRYVNFLRQRTSAPRIFSRASEERLLILDDEPASGRPVGAQVSTAKTEIEDI